MSILHKYTILQNKVQQLRILWVKMSIMTDYEKVEVLANTEIEKLTRITKYYLLQNMILGTNMT
jgi:hypothetical protein